MGGFALVGWRPVSVAMARQMVSMGPLLAAFDASVEAVEIAAAVYIVACAPVLLTLARELGLQNSEHFRADQLHC